MKPPEIQEWMKKFVIGQTPAAKEVSVALYKHLIGHRTGNILMIGNSGSGKTTIMKAVELLLRQSDTFKEYGTVVRINANLLADLASRGMQSTAILEKLVTEARARFGADAPIEQLQKAVSHGIVFIDEVDKIRSHVGDKPNVTGIIAQESLLTLMESEIQLVPIRHDLRGAEHTSMVPINTGGILFIAGGAFEDLYDQVFDRVTAHGKNPPWKLVTKADGSIERQIVFNLAQHLLHNDLFAYGITPQFIARFDSIITLRNLGPKDLLTIFRDTPDAIYPIAQEYFAKYGVKMRMTDDAMFYVADKAAENPRLGARALKEVFGRIIKHFEYDPWTTDRIMKGAGGEELLIDLETAKASYGVV